MATELKPMTENDYAISILRGWRNYIYQEQGRASERRPYCYASSYEKCERKLVLYMTDGDKLPVHDTETLAKFHRGNNRERSMKIDLVRAGELSDPQFEVIGEQQRFELRDHKGRVAIVGKVDFQVQFRADGRPVFPVECKDWDPNVTAKLETFDDVLRGTWTHKGARQLLCYMWGINAEYGFLLLARPGLPKLIPVRLFDHLDLVEEFLQKAESALDHKAAGTLPDYITDIDECRRCAFYGGVCNPPTAATGAQVLTDPELELMLDRREELKAAADEYDDLDADVKEKLRGVETGVAGKFLIEGKWGKSTTYEIPKDVKRKYEKVDPKGRFTLKITKLS